MKNVMKHTGNRAVIVFEPDLADASPAPEMGMEDEPGVDGTPDQETGQPVRWAWGEGRLDAVWIRGVGR